MRNTVETAVTLCIGASFEPRLALADAQRRSRRSSTLPCVFELQLQDLAPELPTPEMFKSRFQLTDVEISYETDGNKNIEILRGLSPAFTEAVAFGSIKTMVKCVVPDCHAYSVSARVY